MITHPSERGWVHPTKARSPLQRGNGRSQSCFHGCSTVALKSGSILRISLPFKRMEIHLVPFANSVRDACRKSDASSCSSGFAEFRKPFAFHVYLLPQQYVFFFPPICTEEHPHEKARREATWTYFQRSRRFVCIKRQVFRFRPNRILSEAYILCVQRHI